MFACVSLMGNIFCNKTQDYKEYTNNYYEIVKNNILTQMNEGENNRVDYETNIQARNNQHINDCRTIIYIPCWKHGIICLTYIDFIQLIDQMKNEDIYLTIKYSAGQSRHNSKTCFTQTKEMHKFISLSLIE